jgi:hypothetical protein
MNKEELKKYFSEQLSDVDRHQLEKTAQTDAFAYEAMEGFEQEGINEADLKDLNTRLQNRVFEKDKVRALNWWKISGIAASIGLVLGLFGGWLLFGLKNEMKSNIVSQKVESTVKEEAPLEINEAISADKKEAIPMPENEMKQDMAPVIETRSNSVPSAEVATTQPIAASEPIVAPHPVGNKVAETEKVVQPSMIAKPASEKKDITSNLSSTPELSNKVAKTESSLAKGEVSNSTNKLVLANKPTKVEVVKTEPNVDAVAKTKSIKPAPMDKKSAAKPALKTSEPAYKSVGEEISLGGLADMLKQEQNEVAKDKMSKADGIDASVIAKDEEKKPEVYKYDYDKAASAKKVKSVTEENLREKKSKIKIPLDVLPSNITFEDYVKIKLREKVYRCPKKGSVKLFVNLDKNKKIEDFTILEVNNKVCIDYAKAIVEEWLSDKASMYDENRAYQFIVNFN